MKAIIGDYIEDHKWWNKLIGRKRKVQIRIDKWDTYDARTTICDILIPLLKRFKEDKIAIAWVENKDVPKELRTKGDTYCEKKWNHVLDEMIWAFEVIRDDELDLEVWEKKITEEEYQAAKKRKENGLRLFAKYFESLWW